MISVLCIVFSYLLGGINPAYLLARSRGYDIRQKGSGNAGASNALILMGKRNGILVALLDIFKAFAAVSLTRLLSPDYPYAGELAGTAVILGHIFPVTMHFRGGKGLACLGGTILALSWQLFLLLLAFSLLLVLVTKYICFVPLSASVLFPLLYALRLQTFFPALLFLPATAFIVYRHMENLARIRTGQEARISFLWNKDGELARLGKLPGQDEADDEGPDRP